MESLDADLVLLDRWCSGDAGAGNELFKRHFTSVYRFFELKTDDQIDDLVQETFLQCVKGRDSFKRQSSFRTYLYAIARHVLFGYWRKKAMTGPTLDFESSSLASLSTSANTRIDRGADRVRLLDALRVLPLEQQILLELYYWEDMDRERLAEVFDVEPATIGSRLFRARETLQAALGGDDVDALARN